MIKKKKVILVFGTRPEAIKMSPLYHELKSFPEEFETIVCVTAQHRHMLDQVLKVFNITPDIDLDLMKAGQDLFDVTSSVLLQMKEVFNDQKPDLVLVHGDTTTALASTIAAFYQNIPVGHIEAGLRTHNIYSPFPEEFNRQVISKIACWHFAPTEKNYQNLLEDQVKKENIVITGNTVIDALFWVLDKLDKNPIHRQNLYDYLNHLLQFNWLNQKFILITAHRRENFGNGLREICEAIKSLSNHYPDMHFVFPVHPNPNVYKDVHDILADQKNVHLIPPQDYEPFVVLLKHCYIILTDSGGIQEEAPSLKKPVLVTRETTERFEAVNEGSVCLVGGNKERIFNKVVELLESKVEYEKMSQGHNPYGDGQACKKITSSLRVI